MTNLINYLTQSYEEMIHKVSWPSLSSLQNSSVLVLVASLIFAIFIGLIDLGFENLMSIFYKLFRYCYECKMVCYKGHKCKENKIKTYLEKEIVRNKLEKFVPDVLIPNEKIYVMRDGKENKRKELLSRVCFSIC